MDDARAAVTAYFDEVKVAGLELPNGWFGGRRMDNLHELSFITPRPGRLLIELDEHLLLTFGGSLDARRKRVEADTELGTDELILSDFSQLIFDQRRYGEDAWTAKVYRSGTVTFAAWVE
jgi:hypothetical protein